MSIALLCAAAFYLGGMLNSFSVHDCYAQVLLDVSGDVQNAAASQDAATVKALSKRLQRLPLRGYESDCQSILAAIRDK
ncbi:hypothetical protein PS3A_26380 [Pseudomonas sp. 3A(2025)]